MNFALLAFSAQLDKLFKLILQNSGETSIMIDHALQHNTSLQNADRGISDLLSSGSSILTSLRDQRVTLKVCSLHVH